MKSRSALHPLCVILLFILSFTSRILADDVPTFSDPDVTAFVRNYAQFVHYYEDAYKEMKAGNNSKVQALQAKSTELQTEAGNVSTKVKREEVQRFTDFIQKCAQQLVDITKNP
jgi:hypothetical protein